VNLRNEPCPTSKEVFFARCSNTFMTFYVFKDSMIVSVRWFPDILKGNNFLECDIGVHESMSSTRNSTVDQLLAAKQSGNVIP
jgi:hypothetical protein